MTAPEEEGRAPAARSREALAARSREALAARRLRDQRGNVVTYAVTAFMIVALAIYLAMAFFADDRGEGSPGVGSPAADEAP